MPDQGRNRSSMYDLDAPPEEPDKKPNVCKRIGCRNLVAGEIVVSITDADGVYAALPFGWCANHLKELEDG